MNNGEDCVYRSYGIQKTPKINKYVQKYGEDK